MKRGADRMDLLELAHALRTPLTSALLAAGLLEAESVGPLSAPQREAVASIVGDLERLRRLVDDGLHTEALGAYAGPLERRRVDLGTLAREAVDPLAAQSREDAIEISIATGHAPTVADPLKLRWVVASLVGNALRYASTRVDVDVRADDAFVLLTVADDGPGIEPDVASRVFERGGPGLTLYLVREIVEAHEGTIEIVAREHEGTSFLVRLPIAAAGDEHERR